MLHCYRSSQAHTGRFEQSPTQQSFHYLQLLRSSLILLLAPEPTQRASAINLKHSPRHVRRPSTTQKQDQPRKILRLPNPPRRLPRRQSIHRLLQPKRCHLRGEHPRTHAVDGDVLWHQLRGLHLREVDARRFGGAIREGPRSWGGEPAFGADGYICGLDAGHGGDVNHPGGSVGCGAFEEEGFQPGGGVEDGLDVEGHEFVPAGFREVVVGGAPVLSVLIAMNWRRWVYQVAPELFSSTVSLSVSFPTSFTSWSQPALSFRSATTM